MEKESPSNEDFIFFKGGRVAKMFDERVREGTKEK